MWAAADEGTLAPNRFLHRRPHMCLKPYASNRQRFSFKYFKLTQTLLDHFWGRLLKKYVPELNMRTKWQKLKNELDEVDIVWCSRTSGLHTPRNLENCECTQRFGWNSKELRHPDGYRNSPKTHPKPCIPAIVRCQSVTETSSLKDKKTQNLKKTFSLYFTVF